MKDRIIYLRLLGVSLLWGINYVASSYLLREFSPIFLSYSRLILTSLFLISVGVIAGKMKWPTKPQWMLLLLVGFFGTLLNQYFYFIGLQDSTAGNAALIVALTPVLTTILARVFLGEMITIVKLTGTVIAFMGVVLIVIFGGKSLSISHGDVYILLGTLALSVSLLLVRRLTNSLSSYDITILSTVIGTVLMTPAAIMESVQGRMHLSTDVYPWIIIALVAIIGQGLAGFWWNQGVSVVGASSSAMFMNIPPFIAIIASYFILGDPIHGTQIVGGVLILLGVALSNSRIQLRGTKAVKPVLIPLNKNTDTSSN